VRAFFRRGGCARYKAELEEETLRAADERSVSIDAELEALLEARKRELEARNERLDHEFAEATGLLEGAISAVRRLTHELVRTLDDAAALVTAQGDARKKNVTSFAILSAPAPAQERRF